MPRHYATLVWGEGGWSGPIHCWGCGGFLMRLDGIVGKAIEARPCRERQCKQLGVKNVIDAAPLSSDRPDC